MKIHNFTSPFTGVDFTAVESNSELIVTNVITGKQMHLPLINDQVHVPTSLLKHVDMIDAKEACMKLHISRQRLSQLVNAETLRPIFIGNSQYFLIDDVLEYKGKRKNGRPKKEN